MHIAIDLGAESGRVIVGDLSSLEVVHRFPSRPVRLAGHWYWDVPALFSDIMDGLKMAFAAHGNAITSIGIDTWGVDYGLLDANGQLLGLPFHYRDGRTDGMMESVWNRVGKERLYKKTGIQFLPFNSVYQLAEEADNRSERLAAVHDFLTIPDLLNFWLCGVKVNEFSNATTTQLLNPATREWDWEVIDELNIPRSIFRDVVPSGTRLGVLLPEIRSTLSAPQGVQVIAPACHDTGSAVAAVPVGASGGKYAYLSSGTWSLLGTEREHPLINDASLAANFTNEGGAGGGYRFLKNIMGLWILQECRKEWGSGGELPDYAEIVKLADQNGPAACKIDVDDPLFLPPGDSQNPMSGRIRSYCEGHNLPLPQGVAETSRVILESLAQRYADNLAQLGQLEGEAPAVLHVIGGGSKNQLLCSLTADASGIPVIAGPVEATALGNILVQAFATGEISDIAEGRSIIRGNNDLEVFRPGK